MAPYTGINPLCTQLFSGETRKVTVSDLDHAKVAGLDRRGQAVEIEAQNFFARVLQHEVDHLIGKVFIDRLLDLHTLTHLREYEQYWKGSSIRPKPSSPNPAPFPPAT